MDSWGEDERAALLALLSLRPAGKSWAELTGMLIETGSALAVWEQLSPASLFELGPSPLEKAHLQLRAWSTADTFRVLMIFDDDYPAQLREIHQAPPILFSRGDVRSHEPGVSIVGSRNASAAGLECAAQLAKEFVASGITVISGLAAGIDTVAHRAALDEEGRTVAVIGTGISRVYPPENSELQEAIAQKGCLLSQFWPDATPTRSSFPMRNAVMSGYGDATVVVEAAEHSGARIQARLAVEHGRPVVLMEGVLRSTQWAASLQGAPGVHIAHDVSDALATIHDLAAASEGVRRVLGMSPR